LILAQVSARRGSTGALGSQTLSEKTQMEIKEYTFNPGAVVLNYAKVSSPGRPLVLLHGGNARWQSFESIIPDLAPTWHVYAPDFRGQGKSGWVPGSYRLQDYTDDTIAFLRHHIHELTCLFGHSPGGIVALMVAAQYPEGVHAVAVGDAPLSRQTWHEHLLQGHARIAAWRDLCGGQKSLDQLIEILKDAPIEVPDKSEPVPMREVMGEDAPVYAWLAANLYQSDPDMLTAILEQHWNGSLLDSLQTVLNFARTMTYNGVPPVVEVLTRTYQTGVKLSQKAMAKLENRFERLPGLEKYFVRIVPLSSLL
jgi:pimeloyl-ACP methyl ester carboxylesterase